MAKAAVLYTTGDRMPRTDTAFPTPLEVNARARTSAAPTQPLVPSTRENKLLSFADVWNDGDMSCSVVATTTASTLAWIMATQKDYYVLPEIR